MNHSQRPRYTFLFLVFLICGSIVWPVSSHHDTQNDDVPDTLPADFVSFVKDLDTMVFNKDSIRNTSVRPVKQPVNKNATRYVNNRRNNNNIKATQNQALRDILMLKLVSYYEDKYNVGKRDQTSTTPSMMRMSAENTNNMFNKDTVPVHTDMDSIEKSGKMRNARRMSQPWNADTPKSTEHIQDYNTIDQVNTMAEVVVL